LRVLISAVGSHGDTLPFVGLGRALQERGHDVRVYGNGLFSELVSRAGLAFVETSDSQLGREVLADRRATQSRSGLRMIAQRGMVTVMPTFVAMERDVLAGETLLIGSSLAFAPRLLAETQRLPFAAVHLAPSIFRSDHMAPRMSPLGHFERWPRAVKRAVWASWTDVCWTLHLACLSTKCVCLSGFLPFGEYCTGGFTRRPSPSGCSLNGSRRASPTGRQASN